MNLLGDDSRLTPADREAIQDWLYKRHNALQTYRKPERRARMIRQLLDSRAERDIYGTLTVPQRGTHSAKWPLRQTP